MDRSGSAGKTISPNSVPASGGFPAMRVPDDTPRRYRIVFRGGCGDVFAGVFSDLVVESRDDYTSVVAAVRDASEFYGLLDRFQDLALQPVSLNEIGGSGAGADGFSPSGD